MNRFARSDVLRILHVTPRQFSGWQKAGLIANGESFTFFDLLQLKKVRDLRARKVRPAVIRQSLLAMQKQVAGMENPLLEAGAFSVGSRVVFRHEGRSLDPIGGQFFMEFEPTGKLLPTRAVKPIGQLETAAEYFARGIALEEDPNSAALAMQAYRQFSNCNRTMARLTSTWVRSITTRRSSARLSTTTGRRLSATRAMPWRGSIWATCWMRPDASRKRFELMKRPSLWLPPMLTLTTILPWPMNTTASRERRSGTGGIIASWIPRARGQCTPTIRSSASSRRTDSNSFAAADHLRAPGCTASRPGLGDITMLSLFQ